MFSTISKLVSKLRDTEYRKAYIASQINIGIPYQLRALMKSRGWTQEQLAEQAGMLQPRISAMLSPGKTQPNIKTLRRLAEAFDCGLMVRFVPFSELVMRSERFDPESFSVKSFQQEDSEGRFGHRQSHSASGDVPAGTEGTNKSSTDIEPIGTVEEEEFKLLIRTESEERP